MKEGSKRPDYLQLKETLRDDRTWSVAVDGLGQGKSGRGAVRTGGRAVERVELSNEDAWR